jgi:PKD repeat protein
MHSVTTHVIAWAPSSATPFPSGYVSGYEQYLNDMVPDRGDSGNISSVAAQYIDASGSALSSLANDPIINDSNPYPTSGCAVIPGAAECLTEQQIITEITNQIGSLPVDLSQSYIVLLPDGVDTCDNSGTECADNVFCGYHDSFTVGSSQTTFTLLPYTNLSFASGSCTVPYPYTPPNGMSDDLAGLDSVGAHELLESATDPLGTAYIDSATPANEIADECAWTFDPVRSASISGDQNQTVNGDPYLIQDMWSNQDAGCVQGDPSPATATVTSTGAPEIDSPISFGVTLSGATAATYAWSYENQSGAISPDVATGADPQITFPAGGTYTVWVEVTDTDGGTVTGVSDVTIVSPPTASFSWSPATPTAGSQVTFSPAATPSTGSITGYSWSFGDGSSPTSAQSPTHAYAASGSYTVTLTVTQTGGESTSVQRIVSVAAAPPTPTTTTTTTTSTQATPSKVTIAKSITPALTPVRGTTIRKLLRSGAAGSAPFKPSVSGQISITWYVTVKHHKIVVARGSDAGTAGVVARVEVRLTAAGRRLLKRSHRLKVTIVGVYLYGTGTIRVTRRITLRH